MVKWAKPDLYDLENDILWTMQWTQSLDSWSISSLGRCIQDTKKSYLTAFERNWQKVANSQIWPFTDLSDLAKWPLERFNQIHFLTVHVYPHWEAPCINVEKYIKQFLWLSRSKKEPNWPFKMTFRMIQPNPYFLHCMVPSSGNCTPKKKTPHLVVSNNNVNNWDMKLDLQILIYLTFTMLTKYQSSMLMYINIYASNREKPFINTHICIIKITGAPYTHGGMIYMTWSRVYMIYVPSYTGKYDWLYLKSIIFL